MLIHLLAQVSTVLPTTVPTATPSMASTDTPMLAGDVLSPYIYVFYASFIVSFLFTPIMRQVALYYGIIDAPDMVRKLHSSPVAYLGGVAVALGWVAGLAISQFCKMHRDTAPGVHVHLPVSILAAAAVIVLLGLADDTRRVRPWVKIAAQVLAALALLHSGIGSHAAAPLLAPIEHRLQVFYGWTPVGYDYIVGFISGVMTIAVVVGCCNAANLMDGLDGLCGGVTAIITAGLLFLAVHTTVYALNPDLNTEGMRVVLALALLGGVMGFIPYNFNPASIFLGDTGSMFMGFSCATLILSMAELQSKWFLAAMVMFSLPVLDTMLAFARRYVNRRPIFSADRHHFHHQLVARGFSVKQTVLTSYLLSICFVLLGAAITFIRTRFAVAIYMVVFGSILVAAYKMGMVHEKAEAAAPSRPRPASRDTADALALTAQTVD
jgi:UDP-GlcNAc:undecaprenyl-phosphate GlcNAc-1-phosphate transferase